MFPTKSIRIWRHCDVMSVICFLYYVEIYKIIKINKTQLMLKYFFGARGAKFLEKRRENVQILQALRWRFDVWEAIFAVKKRRQSNISLRRVWRYHRGNQIPYMRSVMCISYCLHDWQTIFIILFSSFWTVDREKNKIF